MASRVLLSSKKSATIHWNIKSALASPGRSRAGPSLYVFLSHCQIYHTCAAVVLPVPMQSDPSWSRAHNRQTISPSFTHGTACKCPHSLSMAACLAWLVPDLGARYQVPSSRALINHSGYTLQARMATTTIHTYITKF
jgi:hypothetical protein